MLLGRTVTPMLSKKKHARYVKNGTNPYPRQLSWAVTNILANTKHAGVERRMEKLDQLETLGMTDCVFAIKMFTTTPFLTSKWPHMTNKKPQESHWDFSGKKHCNSFAIEYARSTDYRSITVGAAETRAFVEMMLRFLRTFQISEVLNV